MTQDFTRALASTARVLDAWFPLKIAYDRVPGLAVGIVHRGKLVYARGFGLADVENATPVAPKTCFRIASNSKTFTGVAVMQLVEQRKLALDDRIVTYLPWFKARDKDRDTANVTIRQALSHIAGVFRDGTTAHWEDDLFPSATEMRRSVSKQTVVLENATQFKYSNFGFALLGAVIEKVSGSSYADYVTKHIVAPLKMTRTAPDYTKDHDAWLAAGYSRPIPDVARERYVHMSTKAYASATGFLSNVEDLSKYLSALSLRSKSTLLTRESRKELFRTQWTVPGADAYAHGFAVWQVDGKKIVGHGGGFCGFITRTALSVDEDLGVIVLTNANDGPAGFIANGILETVHRFADPARDYFTGARQAGQRRLEGAFRNRWGDLVVVGTGTKLIAFDPRTSSPVKEGLVLTPRTSTTYDIPARLGEGGERARFVAPGTAQAKRMVWGAQPYERID